MYEKSEELSCKGLIVELGGRKLSIIAQMSLKLFNQVTHRPEIFQWDPVYIASFRVSQL